MVVGSSDTSTLTSPQYSLGFSWTLAPVSSGPGPTGTPVTANVFGPFTPTKPNSTVISAVTPDGAGDGEGDSDGEGLGVKLGEGLLVDVDEDEELEIMGSVAAVALAATPIMAMVATPATVRTTVLNFDIGIPLRNV